MAEKQDDLMELARRRGFLWPSFEIYGGAGGFFDYGPLGSVLKNKIIQKWRELYVIGEEFYEIDSPSIMPEEVLRASGHVEHFTDVMAECQKCGAAFKATELAKGKTGQDVEGMKAAEMDEFFQKQCVRCTDCGGELGKVFHFNAMFRTAIGPGSQRIGYLRPETAQGIFIDFKRLQRHVRGRLPFGVVQIGKSYRNEISPRQGIIRLREFSMAEAEVFFDPSDARHPNFSRLAGKKFRVWRSQDQIDGAEKLIEITAKGAVENKYVCNELMAYYMALTVDFLTELGIPYSAIRFREQKKWQRAHYSSETWDAEVNTERFGWVEVAGLANRTDYDLSRHAKFSGEDMTITKGDGGEKIICHVLEPSYGIDRPFYCLLEHGYRKEAKRTYLALKKWIAPVEVGVFPLINRDGLPEKCLELQRALRAKGLTAEYDGSGSIGRRYARADEVGTPYCVTVDHQTLEGNTVTIRDRDTTQQVRTSLDELSDILGALLHGGAEFEKVGEPVKK